MEGTSLSSAWQLREKEHSFSDALLELIAARFRLLGEPVRLKILAALIAGEQNVGELVALTGAGQANISKHLAALMQGGLVTRRKMGTSTYYAIAAPSIVTLCDVVCADIQESFAAQARRIGLNTTSEGYDGQSHTSTGHDEIKEFKNADV
ncbi:MAG TPA: metalloregulator ArsR/SmtB family transcription factor [Ktedonobacteraceae bacterium]|nr:metalloregulator ArsR/SmtB family transcription factor [Ktedonobacteraceae bacterium]